MATTEVPMECPNQTMDESFNHTFSDIDQEGTNADNEIGVPKSPTNEAMGESFQRTEEVPRNGDTTSSVSPTISRKSVLTIVLDLNGLLLKRCQQKPSTIYESIQMDSKRYIVLRPGCIQFLKILLGSFNVGIWSTATKSNVHQILRVLQDRAGEILPFFVVWSQEACEKDKSGKLARLDNPTVQAMFKPLSKISTCFDCDACKMVLTDDSPYKGCASLDNNCIYPTKFDEEKMDDNTLIDELLPYLLQLDESEDVREIIGSNRYGQPPVSNENELKGVENVWKMRNLKWSQKTIYTIRLPLAEIIQKFANDQYVLERQYEKRREEIKEVMTKEHVNIACMKGPQMISLARKLGSTTEQLKAANGGKSCPHFQPFLRHYCKFCTGV